MFGLLELTLESKLLVAHAAYEVIVLLRAIKSTEVVVLVNVMVVVRVEVAIRVVEKESVNDTEGASVEVEA
jgi:hypothetical protein